MIQILIIPNIVFVFLIAIATGYLTFLTTKGGLTDNRYSAIWKKFTKRGKYVFLTLLFITSILILQEWNTQIKSTQKEEEIKVEGNKRDSLLKKEIKLRDSIITTQVSKGIDSSRKKLFEDISIAFATQGLVLDTVRKRVEKISDSSKKIINYYAQDDPILTIDTDGISIKSESGPVLQILISKPLSCIKQ
jgi:hypothetical protein